MSTADAHNVDGGVVPPPLVDREDLAEVLCSTRLYDHGGEDCNCLDVADAIITSGILRDATEVRAKAWDLGWHAHYIEWAHQRQEPAHPITKENPYREATS